MRYAVLLMLAGCGGEAFSQDEPPLAVDAGALDARPIDASAPDVRTRDAAADVPIDAGPLEADSPAEWWDGGTSGWPDACAPCYTVTSSPYAGCPGGDLGLMCPVACWPIPPSTEPGCLTEWADGGWVLYCCPLASP